MNDRLGTLNYLCCLFMLNGQCLAICPSGYHISGGTCIRCSTNCLSCQSTSVCLTCATNYFLNPSTNTCISDCASLNTVTTTYYGSNSVCVPCTGIDVNCQVCALGTTNVYECTICQSGHYLHNGACVNPCPNTTYSMSNPDRCVSCPTACLTCTVSGCTSCPSGEVLNNGQCISTCAPGYYIATVGSVSTCQSCGTNCDSCTTAGACSSCQQPYLLIGGSCSGCVDGYYLSSSNCVKCSS